MNKLDIQLVIFDFDLTLVDTRHTFTKILNEMRTNHNIQFNEKEEKDAWGMSGRENIERILTLNPDSGFTADELEAIKISYSFKYFKKIVIAEKQLLMDLRRDGKKLCIVTGNNPEVVKSTLTNKSNKGIKFDLVLGSEIDNPKSVRIKECINKMKIGKKHTIYIGDHINDITASKKAGVISCAVCTGFHSRKEFKPYEPDFILDSVKDLRNII